MNLHSGQNYVDGESVSAASRRLCEVLAHEALE